MADKPRRPPLIFRADALPGDASPDRSVSEDLSQSLGEIQVILREDAKEEAAQRDFALKARNWERDRGIPSPAAGAGAPVGVPTATTSPAPPPGSLHGDIARMATAAGQPRAARAGAPGAQPRPLQRLALRRQRRRYVFVALAVFAGIAALALQGRVAAWLLFGDSPEGTIVSAIDPTLAAERNAPPVSRPTTRTGADGGAPDAGLVEDGAPPPPPRTVSRSARRRAAARRKAARRPPARRRPRRSKPSSGKQLREIDKLLEGL